MPWIVGIDEAGYGPNLGPFVMASVACRVPDGETSDLWQLLKKVVRRKKDPNDGRLHIEDSKVVYSSQKGLKALERSVLATILSECCAGDFTLAGCIDHVAQTAHDYLQEECWYAGSTPLPVAADRDEVEHTTRRFQDGSEEIGIRWAAARSTIVCPPRFNGLLDRWGSKSIVLLVSLAELLQLNRSPDDGTEAVHVYVDKHGGRNHYTSILEKAIPGGKVVAISEGQDLSTYRIDGLGRQLHLTFQPRADGEHFCVALASMLAKYLRELLMHEFNHFWRQHLPELKPTAGYPVDARRFFEEIRPITEKLGITEDKLWRRK